MYKNGVNWSWKGNFCIDFPTLANSKHLPKGRFQNAQVLTYERSFSLRTDSENRKLLIQYVKQKLSYTKIPRIFFYRFVQNKKTSKSINRYGVVQLETPIKTSPTKVEPITVLAEL